MLNLANQYKKIEQILPISAELSTSRSRSLFLSLSIVSQIKELHLFKLAKQKS